VRLHKTTEVVPLRVAANGLGALRFRLALLMIFSYLAMMSFVIYSARHAPPTAAVASNVSPAMVALAICMTFSVVLTGFFVFVRNRG
jgi:hypothetical protein